MTVHVLALAVELHLPAARSLKAKRAVVSSIVETCRHRYQVAAAETGHQETWQRAELGLVTVSGRVAQCEAVMDTVERYLWSVPEADVLEVSRHWVEVDR